MGAHARPILRALLQALLRVLETFIWPFCPPESSHGRAFWGIIRVSSLHPAFTRRIVYRGVDLRKRGTE
jgi:hypothetical protein